MALDPRLQPLLAEFAADEGPALCNALEEALFELRHALGDEAVEAWRRAWRSVHTLKGSAASLELNEVVRLAVGLEGIIAPIKQSGQPVRLDHLDALLEAAALIRGQLAAVTLGPAVLHRR